VDIIYGYLGFETLGVSGGARVVVFCFSEKKLHENFLKEIQNSQKS
jgi:Zn/Cd-binding protein ZinT